MSYRRLRRLNALPAKHSTPLTYGRIAAHGWPRGISWTNYGSCISRASLCYSRKDFDMTALDEMVNPRSGASVGDTFIYSVPAEVARAAPAELARLQAIK